MSDQAAMAPIDLKGDSACGDYSVEAQIAQNELYIDPAKEKILLAKLDLFLTPIIMLVYLCCFLDRSSIGVYHPVFLMCAAQVLDNVEEDKGTYISSKN
jgi:hypothetical protein